MPFPPLAPPPTMNDFPPLNRVRFRLWQIGLAGAVVLIAGWCYTLGPFAAILASCVAKHMLVAIYAAGLSLPDDTPPGAA